MISRCFSGFQEVLGVSLDLRGRLRCFKGGFLNASKSVQSVPVDLRRFQRSLRKSLRRSQGRSSEEF